ncbi:hypothetical protein SAMN02910317_01883 [Ruminococcaceae bacterium FB2012]|nr:hypothetical protein SAMN02910317_01883 [Ruminococcaceae bacterium FB2012]
MADVIKLRTDTLFNIKMLAEELKAGLMSNFICEEPSCCGNAVLLCFEQYYVRVSNFVSLSVMISHEPDTTRAVIVGSGGGTGVLNLSWGANKSIAEKAEKVFLDRGFVRE